MVNAQIGAKILSVLNGIVSKRTEDGLVLDVSFRMEHGLDGKWGVKWSNVQEMGLSQVGLNLNLKPTVAKSFKRIKKPTPNPKPISVWWPKSSQPINSSHVTQPQTLSLHKSSQQKLSHPYVLACTKIGPLMLPSSDAAVYEPIQTHFEPICTEMIAVAKSICSNMSVETYSLRVGTHI